MRRWWLGFIAGVVFHWLIFLYFFLSESGEVFTPGANLNFQYGFLLVTTFLWGVTGGVIAIIWKRSKDMKEREFIKKHYTSLGFLVGALGIIPLQFALVYLSSLFQHFTFLSKLVGMVASVFVIPVLMIYFGILAASGIYRLGLGFTSESLSLYVGSFLWGGFIDIIFWGLIGSIIGYLLGSFKEKQTLKRSGKDEAKG